MTRIVLVVLFIFAATGILVGCGDDDPGKPTVFVFVSPEADTLYVGERAQFTTVVLGTTNFKVTWDVPAGPGHGPSRSKVSTLPPARCQILPKR